MLDKHGKWVPEKTQGNTCSPTPLGRLRATICPGHRVFYPGTRRAGEGRRLPAAAHRTM